MKASGPKVFNNRYKKERLLGQGAFAKVYLCHDMMPHQAGRLLSQETLDQVAVVAKQSPSVEFV